MDIPFKLVIKEKIKHSSIDKDNYYLIDCSDKFFNKKRLGSIKKEQMISITENRDIIMEFSSFKKGARLYIDTLDYYQSSICKEDENGKIYIEESSSPIILFQNFSREKNDLSYYPFVPGTYQIYVVCDNVKYYAYINIEPKQVTHQELTVMRNELEEIIENLAHTLIKNESASKDDKGSNEKESISNQMLFLVQNCNKIITITNDIMVSPRFKVTTIYEWKYSYKTKVIDHETIKHRLKRADSNNRLMVPKKIISRNLPENSIILKVIKDLNKVTKKAINYTNQLLPHIEYEANRIIGGRYTRSESERLRYSKQIASLEKSQGQLRKLRNLFNRFLQSDWISELKEEKRNNASGLQLDNRYRFLNSIYRRLINMKKQIQLNSDFAYAWKRTDKLYEMWGFVKLLKALQSPLIGFEPTDGWIYGDENLFITLEVPLLNEGTTITMHGKNNEVINLVYDKPIIHDRKLTKFEDPLYSHFPNNRPDTRIDFYKNNRYEASFIIDFKYRPAVAIGNLSDYQSEWKAYKQLLHYSKCDSEFVNKTKDHKIPDHKIRTKSPIAGVWVFYPNKDNTKLYGDIKKIDWLTKVPYSPGEKLNKLEDLILQAFQYEGFI
ncbi:nuclease domain-containing protein [Bacillus velezensis]|uniref:nuclease domain-containing protein n=1 Tax=Bacillus velezensis TaxID=492670 RepID=UPI003F7B8187